jgi:universal stress protein E
VARAPAGERSDMSHFRKILVGVDPHTPSLAAAALGARLAAAMRAGLELFTPVYNPHISLAHFESRERLKHARDSLVQRCFARLESMAPQLDFGGSIECHAAWDHPLEEALIRRVLERGADLLIVALPPSPGSGGAALSSAHWQLVRHCPSPILLTRGQGWKDQPVIVAAIDPVGRRGRRDDLDLRILDVAERLAGSTGGTLHAFHAWQKSLRDLVGEAESPALPVVSGKEVDQDRRDAVYAVLGAADASPARVAFIEGRPETALPQYCTQSRADLVVMGAIARNPFGRIFIGSTAERVLDQLPCDLLVVKPAAFRTPVPRERWPVEETAAPILGVPGI